MAGAGHFLAFPLKCDAAKLPSAAHNWGMEPFPSPCHSPLLSLSPPCLHTLMLPSSLHPAHTLSCSPPLSTLPAHSHAPLPPLSPLPAHSHVSTQPLCRLSPSLTRWFLFRTSGCLVHPLCFLLPYAPVVVFLLSFMLTL